MVLSYVPSLMTGDLLIELLPLYIRKPHNNTDTFTLYHGTFYVPSQMTGDLLIELLPVYIRKPHNNTLMYLN